jgi:hypothetical protein
MTGSRRFVRVPHIPPVKPTAARPVRRRYQLRSACRVSLGADREIARSERECKYQAGRDDSRIGIGVSGVRHGAFESLGCGVGSGPRAGVVSRLSWWSPDTSSAPVSSNRSGVAPRIENDAEFTGRSRAWCRGPRVDARTGGTRSCRTAGSNRRYVRRRRRGHRSRDRPDRSTGECGERHPVRLANGTGEQPSTVRGSPRTVPTISPLLTSSFA